MLPNFDSRGQQKYFENLKKKRVSYNKYPFPSQNIFLAKVEIN